jgi:quercetin dioxygenase-like cupin family protein
MTEFAQLTYVAPGTGERLNLMGEECTFMVSASNTRPPLALMEIVTPPGGGPPALHTHPMAEAFYVLEGSFEFEGLGPDGRGKVIAGPGSTVYAPGGAPHNYKQVGTGHGRLLAIFTDPAAEQFFRGLSTVKPDPSGRPDVGKLLAVMQQFSVAFVDRPSEH